MPGDPSELRDELRLLRVSIRARHQCRAIRWLSCLLIGNFPFQSAPGINAGRSYVPSGHGVGAGDVSIRARHQCRAILALALSSDTLTLVSIRARHQCRAIRSVTAVFLDDVPFQSAPGINAGRSPAGNHVVLDIGAFQSAPGINAGRSAMNLCVRKTPQSFNPRPASMPGDPHSGAFCLSASVCFNPRPASMPGDPLRASAFGWSCKVSIRARHQCRAIPRAVSRWPQSRRFQSAPGINAGRSAINTGTAGAVQLFQSAPGINAGRSGLTITHLSPRKRFNPRPASMPGDPPVPDEGAPDDAVSIRARHQCRAIRQQQ